MSVTPGWLPKDPEAFLPGIPIEFNLTMTDDMIYLDNGQEYKKFPNTDEGWTDCCDALAGLEPYGKKVPVADAAPAKPMTLHVRDSKAFIQRAVKILMFYAYKETYIYAETKDLGGEARKFLESFSE